MYTEQKYNNRIDLIDNKSGLKIGSIVFINDKYIAIVTGMNIPRKEFNFLSCCKGYIAACVYKRYHSKQKSKQLELL